MRGFRGVRAVNHPGTDQHGLGRARSNGKKLGQPRVDKSVEQAIRDALRRRDKGMRKIAREVGVGVSVVQRVRMEHTAVPEAAA